MTTTLAPMPVNPIEAAGRDRRPLIDMTRLVDAIGASDLEAVVALSTPNVIYTGGAFIQTPILLSAVLTTADGRQCVVVNEADAHVFRESSWISDVRSFPFLGVVESEGAAIALLAEAIADHGLSTSRIGLDEGALSRRAARALERLVPVANWLDAGGLFERVRLIKTPAEIELLRRGAYQTDKAISTAFALARPGDTERDLAAEIQANLLRGDADAISHAHVQFGARATVAHSLFGSAPSRPGDVLHVDAGGSFLGYHTDVSRNAIVERPSRRQASLYASLSETYSLLIDAIRPGVAVRELCSLAEREFEARGLRHPWATLGHSVGLSLHEGFELAQGSDAVIEERMVLAVEPSHIEPGDARYDIEDTILVTRDGADVLSDFLATSEMFVVR